MSTLWTEPESHTAWEAYIDWPRHIASVLPKPASDSYQQIFLRLKGTDQGQARLALKTLIDDPAAGYLMAHDDYARLTNHTDAGRVFAAWCQTGTNPLDQGGLFDLLDMGPPMARIQAPAQAQPTAVAADWQKDQPIVAAIDDGIGYLNARFTGIAPDTGQQQTRIRAIWLQSDDIAAPDRSGLASCGKVLVASDLDAMLKNGQADEGAIYSQDNQHMGGTLRHRATELSSTHGTAILDLAGGADPTDQTNPARDWPLLAVQLPPAAVDDTSGMGFEAHLVQGVRWILRNAQSMSATAPIIINISMGNLAGPKDGSGFAEFQITQEAETWQASTGQPVRIVWAFGNSRGSRQVARLSLPEMGATSGIVWRVQPDDLTPSYLELRSDAGASALALSVTPPGASRAAFIKLKPGQSTSLMQNGQPIARTYHIPERKLSADVIRPAFLAVALAPTGDIGPGAALAPAGSWRIALKSHSDKPQTATLEIQRDSTLPGYQSRGRQSYFDAPGARAGGRTQQDQTGLFTNAAITRRGTHSSMVTATSRNVFTVGAVQATQGGARLSPTHYSAEGADWTVPGPSLCAIAEDGLFLSGVLASGTRSGSVRPTNGTSAAAARITRALALSSGRLKANHPPQNSSHIDDFDTSKCTLHPVSPERVQRLGRAILGAGSETRTRRP
ncbi:hypothetical protein [Pseudoprimorskyibacter insulae]|uniref:Peptidase S8/S53 domain-containing protein n=1 Tax=Pseudoprimorskyibacter insulae TaxID=1695997 RepID=A0A2R8AQC4_9RHOB|nr:hypothetical protein [Pseudoprimorskyibacter insulae]SPF78243.1 hypothetical protein PRI8871_00836 [Pseudoprimorskyibacter insulae]